MVCRTPRKKEKADIAIDTARTANTSTNTLSTASQGARKDPCLIASDRIEGTEIFDRDGGKLGTVRKLMIDKKSGEVRNVVVGYGGLFGMGEEHYPMPWKALAYDSGKDGYVINFDRNKLDRDKAPSFRGDKEPEWNEDYERQVTLYYFPA